MNEGTDPEEVIESGSPEEEGVGAEAAPGAVGRLRRMGRRLMDRKELAEDTKDLLGAMLETSDKAKTELVKMVAREFRTYLEELRVVDDVRDLMTQHSLEMHVSLNLKPLAETGVKPPASEPDAEKEIPESEFEE